MEQLTTPDGRILLLRKCGDNGDAYGGFKWPMTVGAEVEAPDWNPRPACGNGLHGLPWGCGSWSLLSGSRWMVFSADPADVVDIDGAKSKVRRARVEHIGTDGSCIAFMAAQTPIAIARGRIDPLLLPGDGSGSGSGDGSGSGSGDGYGYGDGDGSGSGDGYGYGYGYGDGAGYGDGYGSGYGAGYGHGSGYGHGDGYGDGSGDGYGYGYGDGDGSGYGHGSGKDVVSA